VVKRNTFRVIVGKLEKKGDHFMKPCVNERIVLK